ncbi:uncharacterized protein [Periplaneta americana]|uniref:uncharacterized protein n=1 Tax=Periplaneta americana TaxID=6978 RepID=UPI0037E8EEBD
MASCVFLLLVLVCSAASGYHHFSSGAIYGHSKQDIENLNETRQVHPHYDPQKNEKPLLTTCCDLRLNQSTVETELPPESMRMQRKCYAEVRGLFAAPQTHYVQASDSKSPFPPIVNFDRNMSICLFECLSREMQVSNEYGNIIMDKALSITFNNGRSLGLTQGIVEDCVHRANSAGPATSRDKGYLCNMAAVEYEQCILEWVDLLCPAYNQIKAEICDSYREKLKRRYIMK